MVGTIVLLQIDGQTIDLKKGEKINIIIQNGIQTIQIVNDGIIVHIHHQKLQKNEKIK
jgi:predicted DNA-binding antitoxin AbrB/MazE fold protein